MATKITPTVAKALATEVLTNIKLQSTEIRAKKDAAYKKDKVYKELEKLAQQQAKLKGEISNKINILRDKYPKTFVDFNYSTSSVNISHIGVIPTYESVYNKIIIEGFTSNDGETADQFVKRIASEITKTL
jgi:hypothetical protein